MNKILLSLLLLSLYSISTSCNSKEEKLIKSPKDIPECKNYMSWLENCLNKIDSAGKIQLESFRQGFFEMKLEPKDQEMKSFLAESCQNNLKILKNMSSFKSCL